MIRRGQTPTFQERLDITLPCNRWIVQLRDCSDARLAPSGWCASLNLTQLKRGIVICVFRSFDLSQAVLPGYF
jgi:hypothetical protein